MSEKHTLEVMVKYFYKCPICGSDANYNVSPSNVVVQCNICKAKFLSFDFRDSQKDLTTLQLFALPTALVDESFIPLLKEMHDKIYSVSFWQKMKDRKADLEQHITLDQLLKYEATYFENYPLLSQKKKVYLELEDTTLKIPELELTIQYENIEDITCEERKIDEVGTNIIYLRGGGLATIPVLETIIVIKVYDKASNAYVKLPLSSPERVEIILQHMLQRVKYARKIKEKPPSSSN